MKRSTAAAWLLIGCALVLLSWMTYRTAINTHKLGDNGTYLPSVPLIMLEADKDITDDMLRNMVEQAIKLRKEQQ
jgi:hypothetical protein